MMTFRMLRPALWLVASGALFLTSCRENPAVDPATTTTTPTMSSTGTGAVTNAEVNDWILENMRFWYYWNDKIPTTPNKALEPDDFFESLLYAQSATNPNGDRFSWIQASADELKASLNGESKTDGVEVRFYIRPGTSSDVIGRVLYVQKNSPATKAGLMRGDIFYQINGQTLSQSNYQTLYYGEGTTKTYTLARIDGTSIVNTTTTRTTTPEVYRANPVFLDSVYTIGGKTIGYFVYNQFATGPTGGNDHTYDNQMEAVFAKFKARGVNNLVLDLRYNPGGYVTSAEILASLIGKGVDPSRVFYKKEYNKTLTPELEKAYGKDWFNGYFQQKASNIGANLQNLIVLTTGSTASASELVINGLKPFMSVTTVGVTTYGKNVGSITISDDKKRIKWGMQPIVTKSFNSLGQSDYSTGFIPTIEVREFANVAWKPLGDVSEPLLNTAIARITGQARATARTGTLTPELGSSVERRAGGSNMFFTDVLPDMKR